ncbi:MAG: DUF3105 domain-containing protein [Actinomycetota bacterium]
MASKKRRRRPARPAGDAAPAPHGGANVARRERKDDARAAREAVRRRQARRASFRRAGIFAVAGLVGIGVFLFLTRVAAPSALAQDVLDTAAAAGCSELTSPAADAPGGLHLEAGQQYDYPELPATSGYHDPSPLPGTPRVLDAPVQETQAVHTLEHGSVIAYYRVPGDGGVSQEVVDALAPVANDSRATYLVPHAELPDGTGLAITAWNKLLTCPATVTVDQAVIITQGFVDSFACTSNAPEGSNGDGC